jgi:hypothetical protein
MIIQNKNMVTSGQAALFDMLIDKYREQLKSTGLTAEQIKELPWKTPLVETSDYHKAARVKLNGEQIIIQVPTNTKFINRVKAMTNGALTWDNVQKEYQAAASTHALKLIYQLLPKYFEQVHYCGQLAPLLKQVTSWPTDLIWEPTLVKINNHFFIAATNEALDSHITDIVLDDTASTFFKLSCLAIKIDKELQDTPLKEFAAQQTVSVDITELDLVVDHLHQLDVKRVSLGKGVNLGFKQTVQTFSDFIKQLEWYGIEYVSTSNSIINKPTVLFQYHGSEVSKFWGHNAILKNVLIKNSTPIEVK